MPGLLKGRCGCPALQQRVRLATVEIDGFYSYLRKVMSSPEKKARGWEIFDELIGAVPSGLCVDDCVISLHWTLIRSRAVGMALTPFHGVPNHGPKGTSIVSGIGERITGMPLHKLAEFVKSWNPYEATLGLAAVNAALNSPEQFMSMSGHPASDQAQISAFEYYADMLRDKKVAVVGRFPDLQLLNEVCRLSVLERVPGPDDLPDAACEYILPDQDYVFITASALINKTLPRLLEISRNAHVFLVGPSTPFFPGLFKYGIDTLAGTVVMEPESVQRAVQEGAARTVFDHGAQMVEVSKKEWQQNQSYRGVLPE
jgi:uncharacterized protein (DUF4213/DUF364 family)